MSSPRIAAQLDWTAEGAFHPERYAGADRAEYESAMAAILRQWDNQPR